MVRELRVVIRGPAEAGGSYYERTKKPGAHQSRSRVPGPDLLVQYCAARSGSLVPMMGLTWLA
jgi:hypothetical protein